MTDRPLLTVFSEDSPPDGILKRLQRLERGGGRERVHAAVVLHRLLIRRVDPAPVGSLLALLPRLLDFLGAEGDHDSVYRVVTVVTAVLLLSLLLFVVGKVMSSFPVRVEEESPLAAQAAGLEAVGGKDALLTPTFWQPSTLVESVGKISHDLAGSVLCSRLLGRRHLLDILSAFLKLLDLGMVFAPGEVALPEG